MNWEYFHMFHFNKMLRHYYTLDSCRSVAYSNMLQLLDSSKCFHQHSVLQLEVEQSSLNLN